MFVTAASMCKLVKGEEFDVAKRTIASTKLNPEDYLIFVGLADGDGAGGISDQGGIFPEVPETGSLIHEENSSWCKRHEADRG